VITVISLLFPESNEMGPKVFFAQKLLLWQCQKLLVSNYFFVLMNEEKGWINFQKQVYENFSQKCLFFRNFEDILVRKILLDFKLLLKKQVFMSNSNTFQPTVNTFVKSDELRRPDRKIIEPFFTKVVIVCSAKLLTTFFEVVVTVTLL